MKIFFCQCDPYLWGVRNYPFRLKARCHSQKTKVVLKLSPQVRQNVRVKMTTIVNSSKRPSNMARVQIQV